MTAPLVAPTAGSAFVDARPVRGRRPGRTADRRGPGSFPPLRGPLGLPLGLLLGAWQLLGSESSPYFPPPSAWARGLQRLWTTGR